jgi:hypothetical protein
MYDIVEGIHKALRIESTWAFVLVVALGSGLVGGFFAWVIDVGYRNSAEYKAEHPPKQQAVTTDNLPAGIATAPTPTTGTAKAIGKTQPKKQSRKLAPGLNPSEPTTGTVVPQEGTATTGKSVATTDAMVTDNDFYGTTSGFENAGKAERVLLEGNKVQPSPGQSSQIVKNDQGGEMKDITARNNEIKAAPSSGKPRVGFGGFQIPAITVPTSSPDTITPNPAPASQPSTPIKQECAPGASCAQSSGQQGGITAGTINVGPLPLTFRWTVKDVPSTKPDLAFEKLITVTASTLFTPVSIGVMCDSDIEAIDSQFAGNGVYMNQKGGTDDNNKEVGFVSFDSPAMTPERPLYIWIWSKMPLKVLDIKRAVVNNQ